MARSFEVREMDCAEREAACRVLAAAFAHNPSTLANAGGDPRRASRTIEVVARLVKLANPLCKVFVAARNDELIGVLNAAPWPHCQLGAADKLRVALPLAITLRTSLPPVMRMAAARARHDPCEPHWHIGPVGVHRHYQGHGVGSALLGAFLDDPEIGAAPAFLETDLDRNVVLYERFGFRVTADAIIQSVRTWFMVRQQTAA
jgi:GNAT superfamily N-acetyltransferase